MKSKVLVLVAVSLLVCSLGLTAKERRGAELVIQKKDGQQIKGELIAVKQASLLVLDSQSGVDVSVDVDSIRDIKIVKKSKVLLATGIGFLASSVALSAITLATDPEAFTDPEGGGSLALVGLFGLPGLGIGAIVGAILSKTKTIQIAGKSEAEIKKILEKLRRQARIKNAQ